MEAGGGEGGGGGWCGEGGLGADVGHQDSGLDRDSSEAHGNEGVEGVVLDALVGSVLAPGRVVGEGVEEGKKRRHVRPLDHESGP